MYCLSGNSNILLMPFPFFPHNSARTHRIGQSCRHSSIRRFTTGLAGMAKPATSAKPDRPPIDSSGKRSRADKKIPPDRYFHGTGSGIHVLNRSAKIVHRRSETETVSLCCRASVSLSAKDRKQHFRCHRIGPPFKSD